MNLLSEEEYFNQLKDKKVIIVGPAPEKEYIDGFGSFIDSFDVVIRVNRGWNMSKESPSIFGSKTDVLYHCLDPHPENGDLIDFDFLMKSGCTNIVSPYPTVCDSNTRDSMFHGSYRLNCKKWFLSYYNSPESRDCNYSEISSDFYFDVDQKMNTRPNSGNIAFLHLLQSKLSFLYIIGFSFFSKGYVPSYRKSIDGIISKDEDHSEHLVLNRLKVHGNNHKMQEQIDFCRPILQSEKRVKMSNLLTQVLSER